MKEAPPTGGTDLALGLVAAGSGRGVLWGAGAASARLTGHRIPMGKPLAGYGALGHFGDPSLAWGGPVGPPVCIGPSRSWRWAWPPLWPWRPSDLAIRGHPPSSDPATSDGIATKWRYARRPVPKPCWPARRPSDVP